MSPRGERKQKRVIAKQPLGKQYERQAYLWEAIKTIMWEIEPV